MTDTYTPPIGQQQVEEIERSVEWLVRSLNDKDKRLTNASDAGAALAAVVYGYMLNPPTHSKQELATAYGTFMGQHSANFTDSAREASG